MTQVPTTTKKCWRISLIMSPGHLPRKVFKACEEITSLLWPGNTSGSPSQSWPMWSGKGKSGALRKLLPPQPDPGKVVGWINGWMELCLSSGENKKSSELLLYVKQHWLISSWAKTGVLRITVI